MEKEQTKNQQEKNQQENQKKSQKLQWHPAFCSALRLELLEDAENLEFIPSDKHDRYPWHKEWNRASSYLSRNRYHYDRTR